MNPTLPNPDFSVDKMHSHIIECQKLVRQNEEKYCETIAKMGRTIEKQSELLESQNKTIEESQDFIRRFKRKDDECLTEVINKVGIAVSSIFFFLLRLLLSAAEMTLELIQRVITVVNNNCCINKFAYS